jgi:hypothetical protein
LWDFSHTFLVRPLTPAVADLPFDGLGDGHPFGWGEVLADLVLVVFPGQDAGYVHDAGQDGLLLQDVPHGQDAALSEDEFEPVRQADGLKQTLLANAVGQGCEISHIPAVALAHHDVGYLDFLEPGMVCDHSRLQSGSPWYIALVAVFCASTIRRSNRPGRTFGCDLDGMIPPTPPESISAGGTAG